MTDTQTAWCPGCGNFSILKTLDQALEALVTRGIVSKFEASKRAVDKKLFM